MYSNLKGTYTGYQKQIERDAMSEKWRGVKIAASAIGTTDDARAIKDNMNGRLVKAMQVIDSFEPINSNKPKSRNITRIDVMDFPNSDGLNIKKYARGWNCKSNPMKISINTEMSLDDIEIWLKSNGYTVFRWGGSAYLGIPAGLRGFIPDENGNINSVRTRYQMRVRRKELESKVNEYMRTPESYSSQLDDIMGRVHVIDLKYEL